MKFLRCNAVIAVAAALLSLIQFQVAIAHCDTMDGPVVLDARRALEGKNVDLAMKWVGVAEASEVKEAFQLAVSVRSLSDDSRKLADLYFFETLVRLHRKGENEPYTGLNPVGLPVEPGITEADQAIKSGSDEALLAKLPKESREKAHELFKEVMHSRPHSEESVELGRTYVHDYVQFIHFIEAAMSGKPMEHHHGSEEGSPQHGQEGCTGCG